MAVSGEFRGRIWGIPWPYLGTSVSVSGDFRVRIWGLLVAAYGDFSVSAVTTANR